MRVLLIAVNAKYIHSNPAVYSLRAYAQAALGDQPEVGIEIAEYTINQNTENILRGRRDFHTACTFLSCTEGTIAGYTRTGAATGTHTAKRAD